MNDTAVRYLEPAPVRNRLWWMLGLGALLANKARYAFRGYGRGRAFPASDIDRAVEHNLTVFLRLMGCLGEYLGHGPEMRGRTVLELGPGEDLGLGVLALASGAARYVAMDAYDLASGAADVFYRRLLERIEPPEGQKVSFEALRPHLRARCESTDDPDSPLRYICRRDFDISAAGIGGVDFVLSNSALEHFNDPDRTIRQLAGAASGDAVFAAQVDLRTLTRYLRDRDPLNIYRYGDRLYRALRSAGSPNRVRPDEYEASLARHGWRDVRVFPLLELRGRYLAAARRGLAKRFRAEESRMEIVSMVICARRGPGGGAG